MSIEALITKNTEALALLSTQINALTLAIAGERGVITNTAISNAQAEAQPGKVVDTGAVTAEATATKPRKSRAAPAPAPAAQRLAFAELWEPRTQANGVFGVVTSMPLQPTADNSDGLACAADSLDGERCADSHEVGHIGQHDSLDCTGDGPDSYSCSVINANHLHRGARQRRGVHCSTGRNNGPCGAIYQDRTRRTTAALGVNDNRPRG